MKLTEKQVKTKINKFIKGIKVDKRDASYDFCYLYFQENKRNLVGSNMENSCMHLWSFLASWGMLRGSSPLFKCSPFVLKDLIVYFDTIQDRNIWNADVNTYNEDGTEIIEVYNEISKILEKNIGAKPTITLVTKIMLGVFGCVPAVDQYFYDTFHLLYGGFRTIEMKELNSIFDFYKAHQSLIDGVHVEVFDFEDSHTEYVYKKAKLIDMFGFVFGFDHKNTISK